MLFVIVKNQDGIVVGKDAIQGDVSFVEGLRGKYPDLTFTPVDEDAFHAEAFVGPNYIGGSR